LDTIANSEQQLFERHDQSVSTTVPICNSHDIHLKIQSEKARDSPTHVRNTFGFIAIRADTKYLTSFDRFDQWVCKARKFTSSSESNVLLPCIPVEFIAAVDWRVWSAKDSTSSKQAFTVNEATMNHEDTDLSPASIKKERSEISRAD
jgi:hypothetical protein